MNKNNNVKIWIVEGTVRVKALLASKRRPHVAECKAALEDELTYGSDWENVSAIMLKSPNQIPTDWLDSYPYTGSDLTDEEADRAESYSIREVFNEAVRQKDEKRLEKEAEKRQVKLFEGM